MNRTNPDTTDIFGSSLLPAVVPKIGDYPVVSEQPQPARTSPPAKFLTVEANVDPKGSISHYSRRIGNHQNSDSAEGLAELGASEELLLDLESSCLEAFSSSPSQFLIQDVTPQGEVSDPILRGLEATSSGCHCFGVGELRNVVIRDRENVPVARVCFKEKNFFFDSLVLAVYAPPEVLVGTVEESQSCVLLSSEFILGNADGDTLFRVSWDGGIFSSNFQINDCTFSSPTTRTAAQILQKSGSRIRLKFTSKLCMTSKLILVGFCFGLLHKKMRLSTIESS